jgi:hypothetical protein
MDLCGELRIEIYKNLLPTNKENTAAANALRLTCRQTRHELDYEIIKHFQRHYKRLESDLEDWLELERVEVEKELTMELDVFKSVAREELSRLPGSITSPRTFAETKCIHFTCFISTHWIYSDPEWTGYEVLQRLLRETDKNSHIQSLVFEIKADESGRILRPEDMKYAFNAIWNILDGSFSWCHGESWRQNKSWKRYAKIGLRWPEVVCEEEINLECVAPFLFREHQGIRLEWKRVHDGDEVVGVDFRARWHAQGGNAAQSIS